MNWYHINFITNSRMNNSVFQVGDELIIEKGREGIVNDAQWANTGKYWARGTNSKSRTSATRGTHKVFKSRAKQIRRAELAAQRASVKRHINEISGDDEAAHSEEDDLMRDFISYVADYEIEGISEKAKLILTTGDIDFHRWCA